MPNKGEDMREKAGARLMTGSFVGYKLRPGCDFKGEYLVYSLEALEGADLHADAQLLQLASRMSRITPTGWIRIRSSH